MEIIKRNLTSSYKLLKFHFFLHIISYGFSALIYTYIFSFKKKYFTITFLTIQTLLLILLIQMLCLIRTTYVSSFDQIKCALNIYMFLSLIFLILVIIQYVLILKEFNWKNIYKIILVCVSILYYIFDSLIFIYEYINIYKEIKKSISDRISMQLENQNRNLENNIYKNDTQPSEKTNKNLSFEKEDTVYIICERSDKKDNKNITKVNKVNKDNKINKIKKKFKNIKNKIFTEITVNNTNISFNKETKKDKKTNKIINFIHNELENIETHTKRKLSLSEENKTKTIEQIKIFPPSSKEI